MSRTIRSPRVAPILTAALALALLSGAGGASIAHAQTPDELIAARGLFAEALKDQDQRRFDVALEKFRRVQQVRDTAPIRYRIGMCHEGLGRLAQALTAYRGAVEMGARDPTQEDVVKAARARIDAVSKRVPHVSLSISGRSASEVDLRVDDRRITPEALKEPLPVDPGEHVITATATGSKPFRTVVFLPEGGTAALMVPLDPDGSAVAPPVTTSNPRDPAVIDPRKDPTSPDNTPDTGAATRPASARRATGAVVFVGGAALAIGATVVFFLRRGEIADVRDSCPGNLCPASRRDEIEGMRDRAALYGPLSAGLGIAGVAALGIGSYLFLTAPTSDPTSARPAVGARVIPLLSWSASSDVAGVAVTGAF